MKSNCCWVAIIFIFIVFVCRYRLFHFQHKQGQRTLKQSFIQACQESCFWESSQNVIVFWYEPADSNFFRAVRLHLKLSDVLSLMKIEKINTKCLKTLIERNREPDIEKSPSGQLILIRGKGFTPGVGLSIYRRGTLVFIDEESYSAFWNQKKDILLYINCRNNTKSAHIIDFRFVSPIDYDLKSFVR